MPAFKRYTDDELAFITEALRQGAKRIDIAEFFGISATNMTMIISRHNLDTAEHMRPDLDLLGTEFGILSAAAIKEAIQAAMIKKAKHFNIKAS